MKKPIKTNEQGKMAITRYRFNQIKKHKSPKEVVEVCQALLKAQDEGISSSVYNENIKVATDFCMQPKLVGSIESKVSTWISGLITKVNNYKEDHIFIF